MNTKTKHFTWSGLAYALVLILLATTMVGIVAYAAGSKTHNIGGNVTFSADGVEATVAATNWEGLEIGTTDYTPVSYTTWSAESTHTVLQTITYSTDSSTVSATTAAAATWTNLAVNITDTTNGDGTLTFTITNTADAALYTAVSVSESSDSGVTITVDKATATLAATGESGASTTYTITFKVDDVNYNITSFTFSIEVTLSTTAISGGTSASSLEVKEDSSGYYVEMGYYPTTYAGLVTEKTYTSTGEYFTLADGTEYTIYTDGTDNYIQYTPNLYSTSYTYSTGTTATSAASYYKLEPIEWDVLGVYTAGATTEQTSTSALTAYTGQTLEDGQQLVLQSRLCLEALAWNTDYTDSSIDYVDSEIYTYLSKFYTNILSDYSSNIVERTIDYNTTANHTSYADYYDNYKTENVWLLSYDEASTWYSSSSERLASPSDFALATYAYMYTSTSYTTDYRTSGGTCYWWLRSSYYYDSNVVYAGCVGNVGSIISSRVTLASDCVRPALLVNL